MIVVVNCLKSTKTVIDTGIRIPQPNSRESTPYKVPDRTLVDDSFANIKERIQQAIVKQDWKKIDESERSHYDDAYDSKSVCSNTESLSLYAFEKNNQLVPTLFSQCEVPEIGGGKRGSTGKQNSCFHLRF